ncbi:MAG: DNA/RNA non-specific endonuclease [Bacteroidales bacterium]|nr:DNA/RNA non-specific endonuclease [Bacteroidales bacterium]
MKKNKVPILIILFLVLITTLLVFFSFAQKNKKETKASTSEPISYPDSLEIPLFTVTRPEQIIQHTGFTVSYNPEWRIPNWVAYELTREESYGKVERYNRFEKDPEVKGVCPEYWDYNDSGYDRGHMAPAGDMKWDENAMRESFYMTNVCPQNHNLNGGVWKELEQQIWTWARQHDNVYVVCGPIVSENPKTIGKHHVVVPDAFYKVLLCHINGEWEAIGFYFDNVAGTRPLSTYCKTIDQIEKMTGIDFFPQLEDEIENKIEAKYSLPAWNM